MAIIEGLGIAATIRVNGSDLIEYVDPDADPNGDDAAPGTKTCLRYVESSAGAEYEIHTNMLSEGSTYAWAASNSSNLLMVAYSVDGTAIRAHMCSAKGPKITRRGVIDYAANTIEKFRFADLTLHEEDMSYEALLHDKQVAEKTGEIRISFQRVLKTGDAPTTIRDNDAGLVHKSLVLHEKAMKGSALHHATTLSPAVPVSLSGRNSVKSTWVDPKGQPLAIFIFKYRSKQALQEEMIVPRARDADVLADVAQMPLDKVRHLAQQRLEEIRAEEQGSGQAVSKTLVDVDKLTLDELIRLAREQAGRIGAR